DSRVDVDRRADPTEQIGTHAATVRAQALAPVNQIGDRKEIIAILVGSAVIRSPRRAEAETRFPTRQLLRRPYRRGCRQQQQYQPAKHRDVPVVILHTDDIGFSCGRSPVSTTVNY